MKLIYASIIIFSFMLGVSISSFASILQEDRSIRANGNWNQSFVVDKKQGITNAEKSNEAGINFGFDISYNNSTPLPDDQHAVAAYILSDGEGLVVCSSFTNDIVECNFVFSYSIDGTSQLDLPNSGAYYKWDGSCADHSVPAPLTLQDCFNQNSFGQIFKPSESGELTGFTIDMTILNESGGPIEGLKFYLYEIDVANNKLSDLLQVVPVDLDGVPFQTDWTDYQFESNDFHRITIPFTGINLTADTYYGVFPGGDFVPGELPGEEPVSIPLSNAALYLLILLVAGNVLFFSINNILRS